jgi:hypothetical protein
MNAFNLYEAYAAVYDEDLREENEENSLSFIDNLTDKELDIVIEEVVDELLDEGFEFNEVEEIFEEVIGEDLEILEEIELVSDYLYECGLNEHGAEMVLNNPSYYDIVEELFKNEDLTEARSARRRPAGGKSYEEIKAEIDAKEAAKKPKVKAKVAPVKTAQPSSTSTQADTQDSIKDKTATSAWLKKRRQERQAKKEADSAKEGEKTARARAKNIANIRKEKESAIAAKDREVRSRARNIRNIRVGKAVRKGIAQAQVSAYSKGREVAQSAKDTAGRLTQSAKNKMAVAKRGLKGLIRRGAEKVAGAASGVAQRASGVASRMQESVDLYDVVLEHLLEEGYADTEEAATVIMANMSEEWREEIIDEATIMSVTSPSGKKKKTTVKGESPNSIISRGLAQDIKSREKTKKQNDERKTLLSARKKNIERLNAKPGEDDGDYDAGYRGDDDASDGKRHYSLSNTNRDARRRRESGR